MRLKEVFFLQERDSALKKEGLCRRFSISGLFRFLPLLVLCQCASHRASIEDRGLLAQEISNDKELNADFVKRRDLARKYLLKLMIEHKDDSFPLKVVGYPSKNISDTEKVAIDSYNMFAVKLSRNKYLKKLRTLQFFVNSKKRENVK